ncbi:HGxxPAAW family protein [Cellulomonas composti]|nr:HGxxPAAW family protein [Cellulomonas composti]
MSDNTLAHRAQNATVTEAAHLPPSAPPTNHGRTVAAWTTTWVVVLGGLIAAGGMVAAQAWIFWVGIGVALLGLVVGKTLQVLGHGQGGAATAARAARTGGH